MSETPASVWIVRDEMEGECFITVCANWQAAVMIGTGIIKDWYSGDDAAATWAQRFLDRSRQGEEGTGFFFTYDNGGSTIELVCHEVIG